MKSSYTHFIRATAFLLILSLSQQISFAQVGVSATIYPAIPSCSAPSLFVDEEVLPATTLFAPIITAANTTTYTTSHTAAGSTTIATSTASTRFFASMVANTTGIDVKGAGTGSKVEIPTGLTITADAWNGIMDITYTTQIPVAITGMTSAKVIDIDMGCSENESVGLSGASLVTIPYVNFGSLARPMVKVIDNLGVIYTLNVCAASQYTSANFLNTSSNYILASFANGGAQHCYKYDTSKVYIASNHFSTFVVGEADPPVVVPDPIPVPAPVISGSSGGGGIALIPQLPDAPPALAPAPSSRLACRFKAVQPKKIFTDVPLNVWYSSAITRLISKGILKKKTSEFKPGQPLRRADALILAMDAFGIKPAAKLSKDPFKDVRIKDAFAGYVKAGVDNGIVIIKTPFFYPYRVISRAEAAAILLRAGKVSLTNYVSRAAHRDVPANQWYSPIVGKAWDLCVIVGYANGTIRPTQDVINAEFVVMIDRIMQNLGR